MVIIIPNIIKREPNISFAFAICDPIFYRILILIILTI
jgi:hypothetical protein